MQEEVEKNIHLEKVPNIGVIKKEHKGEGQTVIGKTKSCNTKKILKLYMKTNLQTITSFGLSFNDIEYFFLQFFTLSITGSPDIPSPTTIFRKVYIFPIVQTCIGWTENCVDHTRF